METSLFAGCIHIRAVWANSKGPWFVSSDRPVYFGTWAGWKFIRTLLQNKQPEVTCLLPLEPWHGSFVVHKQSRLLYEQKGVSETKHSTWWVKGVWTKPCATNLQCHPTVKLSPLVCTVRLLCKTLLVIDTVMWYNLCIVDVSLN